MKCDLPLTSTLIGMYDAEIYKQTCSFTCLLHGTKDKIGIGGLYAHSTSVRDYLTNSGLSF